MRTSRQPYSAADLDRIRAKITLTPREAAAMAGISVSTLYARWQAGDGPLSVKVGRARRVRRDDLDAWLIGLGSEK